MVFKSICKWEKVSHTAYEESLDKRLIEKNKRREDPLFTLAEKKLLNEKIHWYQNISFKGKKYI